MRAALFLLPLASLMAACGSLTATGGASEFECKAPKGVPCMSMSGVYANVRAGNVPGVGTPMPSGIPAELAPRDATVAGVGTPLAGGGARLGLSTPAPIVTAPLAQPGAFARVSPTTMSAPASGTPLRTPERILRLWIAPMEDSEGTLHDQRYVYVQVDRGQWLLQAFQESAGRQVYAPVKRMPSSSDRSDAPQPTAASAAQDAARRNAPLFVAGPNGAPGPAAAQPANAEDKE